MVNQKSKIKNQKPKIEKPKAESQKPKAKSEKVKAEGRKLKTAKKTEDRKPKKTTQKTTSTESDLEQLLQAGVHFGHQARRWSPRMKSYIWTTRDGVHIFDLVKTASGLKKAMEFVRITVASGGKIIFVGTKHQARAIVKEEALRSGACFLNERWIGGLITNWEQIKKSLDKLADMKEKKAKGEYGKYTKKENILLDKEITRLERFFGGLAGLESIPAAIFVVDVKREAAALKEALEKGVKVVALVDTNSDPTGVDYVIPGNDDAVRSIKLIVSKMADAVIEGQGAKKA